MGEGVHSALLNCDSSPQRLKGFTPWGTALSIWVVILTLPTLEFPQLMVAQVGRYNTMELSYAVLVHCFQILWIYDI
jgi:hypothetical protein